MNREGRKGANAIFEEYEKSKRINIDKPRWDQNTFIGRYKHFWATTNASKLLYTDSELDHAKDVVTRYRDGAKLIITEDELWKQKHIYDSAFHPETGEKMFITGRLSAQVPMNMLITGFMMTFYKSLGAILFWQWFNQSFNAITNYSNRSGSKAFSTADIMKSYVTATSAAVVTAVGLNKMAAKAPPIVGRLVPFASIVAANAVNIPLMRMSEIREGMKITDENDKELGYSSKTAKIAITQVLISRIAMAFPTMVGIPFVMNKLERSGFLKKYPKFPLPFQIAACGVILTFSTPFGCALFPQRASIPVSWLEPKLQENIKKMRNPPTRVYYNKGL